MTLNAGIKFNVVMHFMSIHGVLRIPYSFKEESIAHIAPTSATALIQH